MAIVLVVGARPNFIKAYPVYECLKSYSEITLIHTGQHYDSNMSDIFFEQLEFKKPDIYLNCSKNSDNQTSLVDDIITKLKTNLEEIQPSLVVVFGDVDSTAAAAICANKLKIKLAHVESGLRSGDLTMPEEMNRIIVDRLADYHFCTETSAMHNLKTEGLKGTYFVGNTMIDTLIQKRHKFTRRDNAEKYILFTLHRQSNVDNIDTLEKILLKILTIDLPIIWPVHPRTREKLARMNIISDFGYITLIEPVGYIDFVNLMINSLLVITDSGGIQEETTYLNIPCITIRPNTERPSTLEENGGTNTLIKDISSLNCDIIKKKIGTKYNTNIEGWDGCASDRIRKVLLGK